MKKVLSIALVCVMMLSLIACGGGAPKEKQDAVKAKYEQFIGLYYEVVELIEDAGDAVPDDILTMVTSYGGMLDALDEEINTNLGKTKEATVDELLIALDKGIASLEAGYDKIEAAIG